MKPSYHESTTHVDDFYTDNVANKPEGGDDYVPVHTSSHKPQRPSYPGETTSVYPGFSCSEVEVTQEIKLKFKLALKKS